MTEHSETPPKKWLKVTVSEASVLADALSDYLVGVLDAGVELDVEGTAVTAFLECKEQSQEEILGKITAHIDELTSIFKVSSPKISAEILEDQDWGSNWKKHFVPFAIIPGLIIAPTWEQYQAAAGEKVIVMDPGMAFGTGHHATTRLCVSMIKESLGRKPSKRALDVGTGTGILAMSAVLFGAPDVVAIDNDDDAVTAAAENIALNRLADTVKVSATPLADLAGTFDLVIANIIHDVLISMADDFTRLVERGGNLLLSGLLAGAQVDSIVSRYSSCGFSVAEQFEDGEWAAVWLCRKG